MSRARWSFTSISSVSSSAVMVLALAAMPIAPAHATVNPLGNFNFNIANRYDFHTWVWMISACPNETPSVPDCIQVMGIAQPIAKAFNFTGIAELSANRYTFAVDDPFGLRCGNIYYGPTSPTHDVYSWDATTLAGTLVSSFAAGCDGAPGTRTYPFTLTRL